MSTASGNVDDLKSVASPLDLSLKVVNPTKPNNENVNSEHKSVSNEELLSLRRLHDRLSKTMELLLPAEKLKECDASSGSDKASLESDYRSTMRALLSLVESETMASNEDEDKPSNLFAAKTPTSHVDTWSYWHDYILSLYLMNSSMSSSLPSMPPIPPPPPIPSAIPPPFNFLAPSQNSMVFQNMLTNLMARSSTKFQDENGYKNLHLQENLGQDFGYKKMNSYQFLKDSSLLYNSLNSHRNIGITKTKLLDSPESFGVSLRGNQKYSIYYQQRPNNIFNNNFLSPTCSTSMPTKVNHSSTFKHSSSANTHQNNDRKSHVSLDVAYKKSSIVNNNTNKLHKQTAKNDSISDSPKLNADKVRKFSNFYPENFNNNYNNVVNENRNKTIFENIPTNVPLCSRQRETVFNCSCGQDFENLYSFTIHMKSTHHSPNSSKIERSIPKLVRGQDMWINSETEQTKEILRCMRCHQSFRTLPELTMHMVETNHYSEIVYSDTGKCVFLNSDNIKGKPSYTTIRSPMSSPGDIIRKLKRTLSSSTGSEIEPEEESGKRMKTISPLESPNEPCYDVKVEAAPESFEKVKSEETLQITEADSGTVDAQPDSDSQNNSKDSKVHESKDSCDSVIRQIENFVEKSLPKHIHNEATSQSSGFFSTGSVNKIGKSNTKSSLTKFNNVDKTWKADSKMVTYEKPDSGSKHKEKLNDSFSFKNYPITTLDGVENPLSSLQTLVETIQKNTNMTKEPGTNIFKVSSSQNKDSSSYAYVAKSPVVCDSLSQLQALVAGTSMNTVVCHSGTTSANSADFKHFSYPFADRSKLQQLQGDTEDASANFLSWCHKLGELLGLPQALSQAMLTQDAIKDLTASVLLMNHKSMSHDTDEDSGPSKCKQSSESAKDKLCPATGPENKSFQTRDTDPLEQLKNLLNSKSENTFSNHSQMSANKFLSSASNSHSNSPPAISKKAKCHFCNKPFANKGQVRLHISKGKCSSLIRPSHSGFSQIDSQMNRNVSPLNFDSNFPSSLKLKDAISANDVSEKVRENSTISNKSVNLIREYFKFAKQMIGGNDDTKTGSPNQIESKID